MKILVFASCSKTKSVKYPRQPTCNEITSKESRLTYLDTFPEKKRASELFRGAVNISLNSAVRQLREFFAVEYYIVTAGFGIIDENDQVPPHDCTFAEMNEEEIVNRAYKLLIPHDYRKIIAAEQPDVIYLALTTDYLTAIGDWDANLPCKTIAFAESQNDNVITLPADHLATQDLSRMSGLPMHGVAGYKGDLLLLTTRFLKNKQDKDKALREILDDPDDLVYTLNSIREHGY